MLARAASCALILLLAGCAGNAPAPVIDLSSDTGRPARTEPAPRPADKSDMGDYRVAGGDTLYAIAFRRGLDFRDVAAWNHIPPPYRIYVGQELRLHGPPVARTASEPAASAGREAPATAPVAAAVPSTSTPAATPKSARAAGQPGMFEDVPAEPSAAAMTREPQVPQAGAQNSVPAKAAGPSKPLAAETRAAQPEAVRAEPLQPQALPAVATDSVATGASGVAWRWPGRGSLIGTYLAGDQTRQGIDIAGQAGDPVLAAADGEVVYSGNGLLGYGELIIIKHNASFLSAYGHNRKRLVQEGERIKGGQQIAEMGSSASARDELHFEIRRNGKPVNPLDYLPAR